MMTIDDSAWQERPLSKMADYINGFAFKPEALGAEGLPVIRIEQLKNPSAPCDFFRGTLSEKLLLSDGDLVFSWSASLFLDIWDRGPAWLNQHLFRVIPKSGIEKRFLKYLIEYHLPSLSLASHGSTMKHITRGELEKCRVRFPSNYDEQRLIADQLAMIDQCIKLTQKTIAKQERVRAGLLQALLTRGVDENGEVRTLCGRNSYVHPRYERVPESWAISTLGSLGRWRGGMTPSKQFDNFWNGQTLWVSPKDVKSSVLQDTEDHVTEQGLNACILRVFPAGCIFTVFRSGILKHTLPVATCSKPFTVNQDIKVLEPTEAVDSRFAGHLLELHSQSLLRQAVKAGTTVESIDTNVFLNYEILLPDLGEQLEIVEIISCHDAEVRLLKNKLAKLVRLKSGLMRDLLSGRVAVEPLLDLPTQAYSDKKL